MDTIRMPYHIFITGNIGSGKSSFLKLLKKYTLSEGYEFIDVDVMAKNIIKEKLIPIPSDRNQVFEDVNMLYSIENQILPNIKTQLPILPKFLIIEASTLYECPLFLNENDIVIHVHSDKHLEQTLNRDKLANRAELVSRVQISPWIKSLTSDIEINNNGTLADLEEKAKIIANKLNYRLSNEYNCISSLLDKHWNHYFSEFPWKDKLIMQYDNLDRKTYDLNYLSKKLDKLNQLEVNLSLLWTKALNLAIWFHKYSENDFNKSIQELWTIARKEKLSQAIEGSRSYVSLACELIYSLNPDTKYSYSLHFGDGLLASEILKKVVNND